MPILKIPKAPNSIKKGFTLKSLLGETSINQLGNNIQHVYPSFNKTAFTEDAITNLSNLTLTERSNHIAEALRKHLPQTYSEAVEIIIHSLTPPLISTEGNGLAGMFYMPHCSYIAKYGIDPKFNNEKDPFDLSMNAQYQLTKRNTCEFSIRPFIINDEKRTMELLNKWVHDVNPHIRRLTSEGSRPRLPWAKKIDSFVKDPSPTFYILENLKNDPDLYVRRSVANHVGDIAKDHIDIALDLCENWLDGASKELKWIIRHALRNPFKKGNKRAIVLRKAAK